MDTKEAYMILESLMDGVDPVSGEILPESHVCQEPTVLRALHKALMVLRSCESASEQRVVRDEPINAGKPWTNEEILLLKQLHQEGKLIEEISHVLQRNQHGVERRLRKLGLTKGVERTQASRPGRERAGTPWTVEDDDILRRMWREGASNREIAKVLQRSSYAIQCRIEHTDLLNLEEASLLPPWTLEQVKHLQKLHEQGSTAEEIALAFNRPVESIRARLFYMGLTKESPISLR